MKIINNTNLNYSTIGSIIDNIISSAKGKTHYVGQKEWSILEINSHKITITIRYLKSYVEVVKDSTYTYTYHSHLVCPKYQTEK